MSFTPARSRWLIPPQKKKKKKKETVKSAQCTYHKRAGPLQEKRSLVVILLTKVGQPVHNSKLVGDAAEVVEICRVLGSMEKRQVYKMVGCFKLKLVGKRGLLDVGDRYVCFNFRSIHHHYSSWKERTGCSAKEACTKSDATYRQLLFFFSFFCTPLGIGAWRGRAPPPRRPRCCSRPRLSPRP